MAVSWIYGAWTYRSFHNEVDKLQFAEGEMTFEAAPEGAVRGQLAFRSEPRSTDARLALTGSISSGSPATVRFQGVGIDRTEAEGWLYDYVGYLVPDWPAGRGQRRAFVGSVTRTLAHSNREGGLDPAGEVFSFIAFQNDFPEARVVIPLPTPVREMLASRHHRLHHLVWHGTRNLWLDPLSLTMEDQQKIADLGWAPQRPALSANGDPIFGNGSGEDFLFMHRQMILEVNAAVRKIHMSAIASWKTILAPGPVSLEPTYSHPNPTIPPAGNPDGFAVPPTWYVPASETFNRRLEALKSAEYYWTRMRWWDRQFKDPQFLSTLTLAELGANIEWTVHNDMHVRWASTPRNPETGAPIPQGRDDGDIRRIWDNANYDHLGEQYSSHVNPLFWRIHGWIDDRINDWFAAHEAAHKGEVQETVVRDVPWFKGKWVAVDDPWTGRAMMEASKDIHAASHGTMRDPVYATKTK